MYGHAPYQHQHPREPHSNTHRSPRAPHGWPRLLAYKLLPPGGWDREEEAEEPDADGEENVWPASPHQPLLLSQHPLLRNLPPLRLRRRTG